MSDLRNEVKPIKFQALTEDFHFEERLAQTRRKEEESFAAAAAADKLKVQNLRPNFSFEFTYPAVIFDQVCFSVDRSQQQANIFNECLCRLKSCSNLFAKKTDASNEHKIDILKSINLSVPYGSIFGLLGPSSCGKTTLLRCLVGLLEPSSGSIRLFGHNSKTNSDSSCFSKRSDLTKIERSKCKVPGANVGYMPQDLGLYEDFTIRQLLTMFGQYMGMSSELIRSRIEFMAEFLDLPETEREIRSLSGGQKRRVSFAIACLHMPPLIILDEPTVGVDPLLRQSIWKYLRRLADEENKTIIITTHYIEEAAQADQVALMRAGEILIQDTPKRIMQTNSSRTLEEAFLKICNNVGNISQHEAQNNLDQKYKLYPQPKFIWHNKLDDDCSAKSDKVEQTRTRNDAIAQDKLNVYDQIYSERSAQFCKLHNVKLSTKREDDKLSMEPNMFDQNGAAFKQRVYKIRDRKGKIRSLGGRKLVINDKKLCDPYATDEDKSFSKSNTKLAPLSSEGDKKKSIYEEINKTFALTYALLYKNYRRNVNSLPLLAFQFLLPIIQMISFSLCVGGRPTNIGLGLVNLDVPYQLLASDQLLNSSALIGNGTETLTFSKDYEDLPEELLSKSYLSFIDSTMITIKPYDNLKDALNDVRQAKLWAAMEIGENFTSTILKRFDLENFYQLDLQTIKQSVIKIYPDRSNKVLDMICQRSLVDSYRKFLLQHFEHFKRLPIEVKEPIFDIKPNLISNSIDGYTESIAAGLLASLTYIMAAGLTTFIMVVERSNGILERTFTSGINPVAYLLAHAAFRSLVMMLQIALVMVLTFYVLRQPLVGSIWLAYLMLMTLNLTGISYGLLISSIVTDQNGAALTIVSSLVVKITMSGILWPFEAIPRWLRTICYIQPLTMPVQALKAITLKGSGLEDKSVYFGFLVSITWLVLFLTIASKRFKFYQH